MVRPIILNHLNKVSSSKFVCELCDTDEKCATFLCIRWYGFLRSANKFIYQSQNSSGDCGVFHCPKSVWLKLYFRQEFFVPLTISILSPSEVFQIFPPGTFCREFSTRFLYLPVYQCLHFSSCARTAWAISKQWSVVNGYCQPNIFRMRKLAKWIQRDSEEWKKNAIQFQTWLGSSEG